MIYNVFITHCVYECLQYYFETIPFRMQAALALVEINESNDSLTILLSEFKKFKESDYGIKTPNEFSFYSRKLLSILQKASSFDKLSLVYIHSHNSEISDSFEYGDDKIIFRISYAYIPFGVHASIYYSHGELSGKVWLPSLATQPLNFIYE